ncbi:MAG: hypothetical protein ABIZ49_08425 [Opitutaceae bacterium]
MDGGIVVTGAIVGMAGGLMEVLPDVSLWQLATAMPTVSNITEAPTDASELGDASVMRHNESSIRSGANTHDTQLRFQSLERSMNMTTFPSLSYACPIPWTKMRGDEKERFCSKCARTVVNISLLTEAQRAALLAQTNPGELCISYYRRLSGEFVSAENPLRPAEAASVVQYGVAALTLAAAAVAVDCVPAAREAVEQTQRRLATEYYAVRESVKDYAERVKATVTGRTPPPDPSAVMILGMIACPPPTPPPPPAGSGAATPVS